MQRGKGKWAAKAPKPKREYKTKEGTRDRDIGNIADRGDIRDASGGYRGKERREEYKGNIAQYSGGYHHNYNEQHYYGDEEYYKEEEYYTGYPEPPQKFVKAKDSRSLGYTATSSMEHPKDSPGYIPHREQPPPVSITRDNHNSIKEITARHVIEYKSPHTV